MAFKFGTGFHHVTANTLQMFKVEDHMSWSQGQTSRTQREVMYQEQKCYNRAMDRFSDFKSVMAS